MGSLLRGEDMTLCQLYLQTEAAYNAVSQLGELGIVQFKDLNTEVNAFHKKFVAEIRRTEEMERQLRYFEHELAKEEIPIDDDGSNPEAPPPRAMIDLEAQFESHEGELKELGGNIEALKRNYCELLELQYVLRHTDNFLLESQFSYLSTGADLESPSYDPQGEVELDTFGQSQAGAAAGAQNGTGGQIPGSYSNYLGFIAGVISREKLQGFMRMLFFACRGNVFVRHADIDSAMEDPHTGDRVYKCTFIVFFQGEQLKVKVRKICEGYKASMYPIPDSPEERQEMRLGVNTRITDLDHVLVQSVEQRRRSLLAVAHSLRAWHIQTMKIKAIYFTMNMFSTQGKNYVAECWCPLSDIGLIQHLLKKAGDETGATAPSLIHPIHSDDSTLPTFHRTNKFSAAFQVIIDAYGVASYKEINPAPFAVISFPFLFAVMFGDCGHAVLMLLFAIFLVLRERQLERTAETNDLFGPIYYGRYIILLMSLFSIYTGLLYNDAFSKSFNIFGSSWNIVYDKEYIGTKKILQLDAADGNVYNGTMYPFGMDPIWQISLNKITWTNSFKEKTSVILGVSQMLLGVILSLFNHIYFRRYLEIVCEFIPMLLFLLGIFGYLCALIFTKWIRYDASQSTTAPDLLIGLINMFLIKYPTDGPESSRTWYPGQKAVQIFLVVMCVVCALVMLLAKPLYLRWRHKHRPLVSASNYEQIIDVPEFNDLHQVAGASHDGAGEEPEATGDSDTNRLVTTGVQEEFDFGEIFIHQAIHTIEFCLGCVSHTASYLRLWALSLAHSQLSEVLWNMVLRIGLKKNAWWGCLLIFPLFAFWAVATCVILLGMEGLSAFLHTLRLHWVEFQSKFYHAEGFAFEPYNFREIVKNAPRKD